MDAEVIAITGSLGKTTVKEFLKTILSESYKTYATPKSYNSQLGLPISILNIMEKVEKIVLEMGMTGEGHIRQLVDIAPPDIAALIAVEEVHLGFFTSIRDILHAKAEIFSSPKTKHALVYDKVQAMTDKPLWGEAKLTSFSTSDPRASYFLSEEADLLPVYEHGVLHKLNWKVSADHHRKNLLAAVALARLAGQGWTSIECAVEKVQLPEGRFQVRDCKGIIFIDDAFNACEESIRGALQALSSYQSSGKTYMILGDVVDLGEKSVEIHKRIGKMTVGVIDELFCVGPMSHAILEGRGEAPSYHIEDREKLEKTVISILKPGDKLLVKGSNSHALWKTENHIRMGVKG
jgi:UDP-N-acetylmuramoyl-tripeptide--D-alanyl-D-alanine ligase